MTAEETELSPVLIVTMHDGCRKRFTENHCAILVYIYKPLAYGVICGIRGGESHEQY